MKRPPLAGLSRGAIASIASIAAAGLMVTFAAEGVAHAEAGPPQPPFEVRHAPLPDTHLTYHRPVIHPTFAWALTQLVPSPELVVGRQRHIELGGRVDSSPNATWGLRWQLTPLLWSFGVHRAQSRWRTFIVDPIARQSGSLELSTSVEYIGGWVDRLLVRPGLRVYLPVAQRGENLSVSFGTSVYGYDGLRVAYDVGAYILAGMLGLQVTLAPTHDPMAGIVTLRLRYF